MTSNGVVIMVTVTAGVIVALAFGKMIGISSATYLTARFTNAELDDDLTWTDVFAVATLAGVGFTVPLLIGELAFGVGSLSDEHVKVGVLLGSLTAAVIATLILRIRNAVYRRICEDEERDDDHDGILDIYQRHG